MSKQQFFPAIIFTIATVFIIFPVAGFAQYGTMEIKEEREPVRDPFKVLIEPEKRVVKSKVIHPDLNPPPAPPSIPPLIIKVTAIAGEAPNFVAVIKYKGNGYIVESGDKGPDNSFKVRKIYENRIEVYYSKDRALHTFNY